MIEKLHRSNAKNTVVFSKILKVFAFYPYPIGSWVADQSSIISHWIWWLNFDIFGILTNLISFYTDLDITIVFCVPKYPLQVQQCHSFTCRRLPRMDLRADSQIIERTPNMLARFFRNAYEFRLDVPNPSLNITSYLTIYNAASCIFLSWKCLSGT